MSDQSVIVKDNELTGEKVAEKPSVAEQLVAAGVPAKQYKKAPAGESVFILSIHRRKTLMVWPGSAEVEVIGDKAKGQAVINVIEKARTVTQNVTFSVYVGHLKPLRSDVKEKVYSDVEKTDDLDRRAREIFPITFPNPDNVTWEVEDLQGMLTVQKAKRSKKSSDILYHEPDRYSIQYKAKVTAKVKASVMTFLVGYDEQDLFISMLPRRAKSVDHAHDILRPPGLSEHAIRQGEFYFDPVTDKVRSELDWLVESDPPSMDDMLKPKPLIRPNGDTSTQVTGIA